MTTTTPTRKTRRLATLLASAAALLAVAIPSAAAGEGPTEGAPGGCALQCIEKALVTATASSAKLDIVTAVRARVTVTARRLAPNGTVDGPAITVYGRFLVKSRTMTLRNLQPKRTYAVNVAATDAAGHEATRNGKFTTRAPETTGLPTAGGFTSGAGCSSKCITKAVPLHIGPTAGLFEIGTNAPAKVTVITSLAGTGSIVSMSSSPTYTQSYRHTASPLQPGTRYDIRIRATDSKGRTEARQFAFTTVERMARVTFWKIQVLEDGDAVGQGELAFAYYLGTTHLQSDPYVRRNSGDVFDVRATGTSRAGLSGVIPANGPSPKLAIHVTAEECDALLLGNCTMEVVDPAGFPGGSDSFSVAGRAFGLGELLPAGAVPPSHRPHMPEGHQRYLFFDTTQHNVKFRVYATVDFFYAW